MKRRLIMLLTALALVLVACSSGTKEAADTDILHLKVHFESNWFFSKYGVDVEIDNESEGTMAHGEDYEKDITLTKGAHILSFYKDGDKEVSGDLAFDLDGEMSISCTITAHSSEIEISDVNIKTAEEYKSAEIQTVDINDVELYKDETTTIGYETKPVGVIVKGEKVSVENEKVANVSIKDHLVVVKGVNEGSTIATLLITDAHGNTAKAAFNITVSLTEEQKKQKEEEEASKKAAEEESARKSAEEEASRKSAEAEASKKAAEEEASRKSAEAAASKAKAEKEAKALAKVKKELGANYNLAFVKRGPEYNIYYLIDSKAKVIRNVVTHDTGVMYATYKGTLTKGVTYKWKCTDGFKERLKYNKNAHKITVRMGNSPYTDDYMQCNVKEAEKALYKIGNKQMR